MDQSSLLKSRSGSGQQECQMKLHQSSGSVGWGRVPVWLCTQPRSRSDPDKRVRKPGTTRPRCRCSMVRAGARSRTRSRRRCRGCSATQRRSTG
eukprot:930978-Pyramimonas_sp.AAC.1